MIGFEIKSYFTGKKFPIETLMEEFKPVVAEKNEFEDRETSKSETKP